MSGNVRIFLGGLAAMAIVFTLLALAVAPKYGETAKPAALAAVWLGALAAAWGFFQLRRSLDKSNLEFLKAFFGGLALRFAVLTLLGLTVYFATAWDIYVFMVSLALTYPLYLGFEAWRIGGETTGKRGS
jgi:hypothetical protein